jgi:ubiquinone/menaquinone biosynthesis C-methylase UbiE
MPESEFALLIDLHKDGERQGPGSDAATRKALSLIGFSETDSLQVADIGCGTGAQTLVLAEHPGMQITAVDLFPEFLEILEERAREKGVADHITTRAQSMEALGFSEGELDLIWSEGAIYNIGFEEGIRAWKRFLKPGGFLAVSEISWITGTRPAAIESHWNAEYPQIATVSRKIALLEKNGYLPWAHFILPPACWTETYYNPMKSRFRAFLERNGGSEPARRIVEGEEKEIALYEQYGAYYSYGFYIAKKL